MKKVELQNYLSSAKIAALSYEVLKVEKQESLWKDSTNRVITGVRDMAKGYQEFSVNTINLMVSEEYNHLLLLVTMFEESMNY